MTVTPCYTGLADSGIMPPMKYWEVIADKLSAAGWSWGYCSAVTPYGWRWIGFTGPITRMTSDAVVKFLGLMEGGSIDVCLDGGWGIDALLGEQTREHRDLDIIICVEELPRLLAVTEASRYIVELGGTTDNIVLR